MTRKLSSKKLFKELEKVLIVVLLCLAAITIVVAVFNGTIDDTLAARAMTTR